MAHGISAQTSHASMGLRRDIEGLRGVAVALVVLFHAKVVGLDGGFIGVDVFYVLSGFLITGILLSELTSGGHIDIAAFYVRRAKRILPAAIVAIVVTLGAAALIVAPLDLAPVALDATFSALFVSNLHFAARASDYFASTTPSPFLHYWSLAVEEQFYLLWPITMVLAARLHRVRLAIWVILVSSLLLSLMLTAQNGPWSFYSLPTRAWELALGAALAYHGPRLEGVPQRLSAVLGWVGLLLLAVSAVSLSASTPYPGSAALLPTVGAALLVFAGTRRGGPGVVLSVPPLRALGRVSYSVYLYHWPLLTLGAVADVGMSAPARWSLVVLSVIVGAVSWRLIEDPLRRVRITSTSARPLAWATAAVVVVALGGLGVAGWSQSALIDRGAALVATDTMPTAAPATSTAASLDAFVGQMADAERIGPVGRGDERPSVPSTIDAAPPATLAPPAVKPAQRELRPRLVDVRGDGDGLNERGCGLSLAGARPPVCVLGDPNGAFTVALVGDSHAAHWFPALELIARERHWRLVPLTKDSCIFLDMRIVSIHLDREYVDCARWRAAVVGLLQEVKPDLVVVSSSRWVHPVLSVDASVARQVDAMARLLSMLPGRLVVLADTPILALDVPACLSRLPMRPDQCATSVGYGLSAQLLRDAPAAERSGALLVDPGPWLCGPTVCPPIIDSTIVYRDDHHLTATFARALAPLLDVALAGVVAAIQAQAAGE
jgi:peptidoglycan/LPS O-acetylase OafA/YrhL